MKNIYVALLFGFVAILSSCSSTRYYSQTTVNDASGITYQQFYDDLSPYGQWVSYQNYGYVWTPDVPGFRPYYNDGHWVYTDYGWTWISDYNWGWAPFHYGRWLYDYSYGWMWVPGYQWAPAWVAWRGGGDYYGWAPLGPGMNISANYGSNIPTDYWAFVPQREITSPRINNYYVNRSTNTTIIQNTTIINNSRTINNNNYIAGPAASDVESRTNESIRPVRIVQRNSPGSADLSGSSISIYHPAVRENPGQNEQIKPNRIADLNEIKARRNGNIGNGIPPVDNNRSIPETQRNNNIDQNHPANNGNNFNQKPPPNNSNINETENKSFNDARQNQPVNKQPQTNIPAQKPLPGNNDIKNNNSPEMRTFPSQKNMQQPPVNNIPPANRSDNANPGNPLPQARQFNAQKTPNSSQQKQKMDQLKNNKIKPPQNMKKDSPARKKELKKDKPDQKKDN